MHLLCFVQIGPTVYEVRVCPKLDESLAYYFAHTKSKIRMFALKSSEKHHK